MTFKDVANTPFAARAGLAFDRTARSLGKVPNSTWRTLIFACALFWAVHSLGKAVWYLLPTPELPAPQVVATTAKAKAGGGSSAKVDIDSVIAMNLLGEFNAAPMEITGEPEIVQETVPVTELNIKLQGIIAASDPSQSRAVIGPNEQNQKMYEVDEEIEGVRGVKIAEIFDLKVRLNNNGKMEDLWLYGEDGTDVAVSGNYTPPPVEEPKDGVDKREVKMSDIQQARNIGDVVRFMVATENGKMIGYKVRPGRKRELFDQVGLQTDDIVVSVNGIEVNEPQKVREVYQALKNATEANLQVMRDGTTHSIQISMSSEG